MQKSVGTKLLSVTLNASWAVTFRASSMVGASWASSVHKGMCTWHAAHDTTGGKQACLSLLRNGMFRARLAHWSVWHKFLFLRGGGKAWFDACPGARCHASRSLTSTGVRLLGLLGEQLLVCL